MNVEEAYQRGLSMAREKFKAECRDYELVLMGIAQILTESGKPTDYLELNRRWHYPLAGIHGEDVLTPNKAISEMLWVLRRKVEDAKEPYHNPLKSLRQNLFSTVSRLTTPIDAREDANRLLDAHLKRADPTLRRNSPRWKNAWDDLWLDAYYKAVDLIKQKRRLDIQSFEVFWKRDDLPLLDTCQENALTFRRQSADMAILAPGSDIWRAASEVADEIDAAIENIKAMVAPVFAQLTGKFIFA